VSDEAAATGGPSEAGGTVAPPDTADRKALGWKRIVCLMLYYGIAQYIPKRWFLAKPGIRFRAFLARYMFAECGWGLDLGPRVYVSNGVNIHVGNRSGVNSWSRLEAIDHIYIGDHVNVGPQVIIHTSDHEFRDRSRLIQQQGHTYGPVRIGNDVFIGARVCIKKGVTIHDGAVVGTMSMVTKDVEPYAVVAGVPARKVGERR
jgi:maltose O-acetyltransferase